MSSGEELEELPVEISFKKSKESASDDLKKVQESVQKRKERIRASRREKQEVFQEQKKAKPSPVVQDKPIIEEKSPEHEEEEPLTQNLKKKRSKRTFSSLGISVQALSGVSNTRAATILDFKSKRLAKAHREPIRNLLSYEQKLLAKQK